MRYRRAAACDLVRTYHKLVRDPRDGIAPGKLRHLAPHHQQEQRYQHVTVLPEDLERLARHRQTLLEGFALCGKASNAELDRRQHKPPSPACPTRTNGAKDVCVLRRAHKWCALAVHTGLALEVAKEVPKIDVKQFAAPREHHVVAMAVADSQHKPDGRQTNVSVQRRARRASPSARTLLHSSPRKTVQTCLGQQRTGCRHAARSCVRKNHERCGGDQLQP